jgi:hypothetical protein
VQERVSIAEFSKKVRRRGQTGRGVPLLIAGVFGELAGVAQPRWRLTGEAVSYPPTAERSIFTKTSVFSYTPVNCQAPGPLAESGTSAAVCPAKVWPTDAVSAGHRSVAAQGFSLPELKLVVGVRDRGGAPCRSVRALVAERLDVWNQRLEEMRVLRDELRVLLSE